MTTAYVSTFVKQGHPHPIQAAIDSQPDNVVVEFMNAPYVVPSPISLRSNLDVLFEPGVVVEAAPSAFLGAEDSLIWCDRVEYAYVTAYGATFRMRQDDYKKPPYVASEHRHGIALRGCTNFRWHGGTIASTGGDCLYIGGTWDDERIPTEHSRFSGMSLVRGLRNGISVINAKDATISNCEIINAGVDGMNPRTGIDFEPNSEKEVLSNVLVENCVITNADYSGIAAPLQRFGKNTRAVSIKVKNTLIVGGCKDSAMQFRAEENSPVGVLDIDVRIRDVIKPTIKTHLWKSKTLGLQIKTQ